MTKANINITLCIEGLKNNTDQQSIEQLLQQNTGIAHYSINSEQQTLQLDIDNKDTLKQLSTTLAQAGYPLKIQKKSFAVLKMSCASCALSIDSLLQSQMSIISASVNFASSKVSVIYYADLTSDAEIQKMVQSIGFDLIIEQGNAQHENFEIVQAQKLASLKKRTFAAILLASPLFVIGMFFMHMPYANYIMWALSTPILAWLGRHFFINAIKQARMLKTNMDTLVALSTSVAYVFSVFNTLYPEYWHSRGLEAHVYFEAAGIIIAFILLGKLLEENAKSNTSSAIKKLMQLQPKTVTLLHHDGQELQIPIEQVEINNILLVKPGDRIPVDGVVTRGTSFIDESMMTGEAIPVEKMRRHKVFAGTINQKGSLEIMAEKVGNETILSQIIKTVQEAQGSKAPVQKLVDKIASIFVPIVIAIALISFGVWYFSGIENAFTQALLAMITVLVIACPCALGLATPTAIMVGVGKAAENGILIKDADSLELARKLDVVVLDKTGTITQGKPTVSTSHWYENEAIYKQILLSIESQSEHPLADAVVRHLARTSKTTIKQFESITGKGAKAQHNEQWYFVGNQQLMLDNAIACPEVYAQQAQALENQAQTVIWFASNTKVLALLAIADEIKPGSAQAIHTLQKANIKVVMLTGDNATTAQAIAQKVGIKHYEAQMLPSQKADYIKKLQAQGHTVAMVGDGINDSTALALADVSIAMGKGSDIAMDVARMTIISSDLNKIPEAIKLSKQTVKTIHQNLFWAFIYNIIAIPIAAGLLYPINGFLLDPMWAGAAMALSSVSVVTNSLRLKGKKI